jgi:hypothetical protein
MKHWIAILIAVLTLTGCVRDANNFKDETRSYMPVNEALPALDQCISKDEQMVRCDRAK